MPEAKYIVIFLPLLASLATVAGQLLYKHSANIKGTIHGKTKWFLFLMAGNLLFVSAVVCNFIAMKFIALFIVYSFTALNYIFITVASRIFLKEDVRPRNVLASLMLASGVFLISTTL
jgi:drug/metabolite transporter (DMT)-like permease